MEKNQNSNEQDEAGSIFKSARAKAIKILSRFERSDSYIDKLLDSELNTDNLNRFDKSLLTEIVNGVIRWKNKIDWVLTGFYHGDYQKCLNVVKNSMRVALYQIQYLDKIPLHAAIYESVEIVKRIQGEKTAGIVNGVLRNIARNLEIIRYPVKDDDIVYYYSIIYSHPRWMVKRWLQRFGEENTEKLLQRNNLRPYLALRVNLLKSGTNEIENILRDLNIYYYQCRFSQENYYLKTPHRGISSMEIFQNGKITIQDASASLAVKLASPVEGQSVVDLCAAPGGKSFYMAEMMKNKGKVIAIDKYDHKLNLISNGAQRLGLTCIETLAGDSSEIKLEEKADLVFADVPCSGLGTLSKKPDIKWKREREDIINLAEIQRSILDNAADMVKPGGVIVYSTCTIEPEENEDNVNWFLDKHPEFELDPAEKYLPAEVCKNGFFATFPHVHKIDGAFAARLVKKEDE